MEDLKQYVTELDHLTILRSAKLHTTKVWRQENYTPSLNNKGTSHVLEHCIVSEICCDDMLSVNGCVYQSVTSYNVTLKSWNGKAITEILNRIFNPVIYETQKPFFREGWRIVDCNGKLKVRGTVYNELLSSFSSSLYCLVNAIPKTLSSQPVYGNYAGGLPWNLIELTNQEMLEYHKKYYIPQNCCVTIHSRCEYQKVSKELSPLLLSLPICNALYHKDDKR